jgi:hypothetical protein
MPATEQEKADLSKTRGTTAAHIADPAERRDYIAAQGKSETAGKDQTADLKQADFNKRNELVAIGSMEFGGTAKRSGPYLLHAGEKIQPGKLFGGSERVSPRSMKGQALLGRNDNLASKAAFKRGPVIATCGQSDLKE